LVDRVEFVFVSGHTAVYGGTGGEPHSWQLEPGEWIVEVKGKRGLFIDSIQFVTNRGRSSPLWGGGGGGPYSYRASKPECGVVGLRDVTTHPPQGWLKSFDGVLESSLPVVTLYNAQYMNPAQPSMMQLQCSNCKALMFAPPGAEKVICPTCNSTLAVPGFKTS